MDWRTRLITIWLDYNNIRATPRAIARVRLSVTDLERMLGARGYSIHNLAAQHLRETA